VELNLSRSVNVTSLSRQSSGCWSKPGGPLNVWGREICNVGDAAVSEMLRRGGFEGAEEREMAAAPQREREMAAMM
jgi:hypothetical protein